jgi:hypothetical protein
MIRRDAIYKAASWKSMVIEGFLWFNTQKKVRFRLTERDCTKPYFCRKFHLIILCCILISGCATYVPPKPGPTEFQSRVETQRIGGVRVSAVILGAEESRQIFGSPLAQKNIQPIWLEVENQTDQEYVLLDIASSGHLGQAGYTKGVGHSSPKQPRYNYTDDPYYTDGLRLVLFLTEDDISYDRIHWYDWEVPPVDTDIWEDDTK